MSFTTQANDWQVLGIAQLAGGAAVGGGIFFLEFKSATAQVSEAFVFLGGGLGVAAYSSGTAAPFSKYESIACDQSFSITDLNNSPGRITSGGISLVAGFGILYISAFNLSGPLFSSQGVYGPCAGVGAGLLTTFGIWRSITYGARDIRETALRHIQRGHPWYHP